MMADMLDKYDIGLLDALQREDGISLNDLSQKVNLSASQCSRRITRLKEAGYIQRQATLLNPSTLGLDVAAFVTVSMEKHEQESVRLFELSIAEMPQVIECHATAGEGDYLLKVVASSNQTLTEFIMKELLTLKNVKQVKTALSLSSIKSTTALPL